MCIKINVKKHIIGGILVILLSAIPILSNIYFEKPSLNVSALFENENINDMSLTIYYKDPYALMFYPISSVEDLIQRCDDKIVINGSDLEEYIDLFKKINNDDLKLAIWKSSDLDLRVYYVLESKKNGKLLDVVMWGSDDNRIFVNGIEVKGNKIFGDVIMPFLSEDEAKELEDFIIYGRDLVED